MSSLAKKITIGKREISVPVTLVDQVVNYFNPRSGAQRFKQRLQMALSGGYTAADKTRRENQKGGRAETDADGAILPDLQTLREDSQHLLRNSPLAVGSIQTNVTHIVGTGLKAKPQIDRTVLRISDDEAQAWERAAQREFFLAVETREFDLERSLPFSLQQAMALLKVLEDGDLFVNLPRLVRPGSPYKIKTQMIEAARICNPDFAADTATTVCGIEKDINGAPVRYHVASRHPGTVRRYRQNNDISWQTLNAFGERTGAPQVLHLFDKKRPGQTRGVPYLAPVMGLIKQLGRYTDAEVMAAVVNSFLTVFVTTETGDPELGEDMTENTNPYDTTGMELGHGSVIGLTPNAKVTAFDPSRPNTAFDPFIQAVLRQIGVALEIPFELLIKHFTASYSAARAALEEAWGYFVRRRHWLATMFCQPIYEAVIFEAVATGRLRAPGFFSDPMIKRAWLGCLWIGDGKAQIDPLKEINAAARRVELTISSLEEESLKFTGTPWEDKLPQILKERKILRENGITITTLEQVSDPSIVDSSGSDLEAA